MNIKKYLLLVFISILFSAFMKAQSVEYSVKAYYLEKIARLTNWKNDMNGEYFVIDVLGESPFNGELEKLSKKLKIKNKPVKINYITNYKDIKDCQMLFICASEKKKLPEIINQTSALNILIISDTAGFSKKGVHINFYIDETETIKYEINPVALKKSGITVELQLLNYGKIIN